MKQPHQPARPWTPADDAQLLALLATDLDRPSIALKLNRTVHAIATRKTNLKNQRALVQKDVPRHPERQLMQHLRSGGWHKAATLPTSPKLIGGLLKKGWIEQRGTGKDLAYRITDKGLVAKKAPVRI